MKFNWGTGIAAFYLLFMSVMIYFVISSFKYDNSLVVENYYDQDLAYQQHYDKKLNTARLQKDVYVKLDKTTAQLNIYFPKEFSAIDGKILIYNPIYKDLDLSFSIQTNANNNMVLPLGSLAPGRWILKIDWKAQDKAYYTEKEIML